MPEVPPPERDPESERAADAAPSPFARPPGPFDQPAQQPVPPAPGPGPAWGGQQGAPAEGPRPSESPFQPPPRPPAEPFWLETGARYLPPAREFSFGGAEAAIAAPAERRSIVRPIARGLRELAETVILALVIFLLVRAVVQNFQVEGRSMEPTLETGWYLLVNKALYWEVNLETLDKFVPFLDPGDDPTRYLFRGPKRGDIIVFRAPNQAVGAPERDFIKRIVGLPGETVEVRACKVFVNGQALDEPYIEELPLYTYGLETVPPGQYFVLGDNRNNSSDSHSWGMLPKENIIGQAWFTYWPFGSLALVDNTSVEPGQASGDPQPVGKPTPTCT
jgi:signal peptidase I